jgi:hypothetical protein
MMKYNSIKVLSVAMGISLLTGFSLGQDHDTGSEQQDHGPNYAEHHDTATHAEHHSNGATHAEHHATETAQAINIQSSFLAMGLEQPSEAFTATHSRLVAEASMALAEANNSSEIVQWPYELASNEIKALYDYNREAISGLVPIYKLALQETEETVAARVMVKVLEDMADHWYAIRQLHFETLTEDQVILLDQTYSNILNGNEHSNRSEPTTRH